MSYLVASVAGVAFFVMSVTLLGVWPGRVLENQIRATSPPHALALTDSERRGRAIYGREGCAYCHTQQIRFVAADVARFGAPTLAWETRFDYPHLWGTRRIGPDLARAGSTRSEDWHFVHLYSPRDVVPDSVMPAYPSLFDGTPNRPRQAARDLVAYLESLGRAREVAGPEGEALARAGFNGSDNGSHDGMPHMEFSATVLNASPARARRGGSVPALPAVPEEGRGVEEDRGRMLFNRRCASCHGTSGQGDGPGAYWLRPRPTNLAEREYTRARLADVLWNGVPGTAMPAWRDHAEPDLAAIAAAVRALHTPRAEDPPPAALVDVGRRVYEANCTQCHGAGGAGDGFAAAALRMAPTDFRRQRPSLAASLRALRTGVAGTPMAPFMGRLSETELLAVAHHVRTFFQPDAPAGR